jgi:hypothetical protein
VAFFADYPDGLLISLCRRPGDWFASASRHSENYADPAAALALWQESVRSSLALKQDRPEQVLLLTFESLIERPREVMSRLAERIGIPFDDILLTPSFNGRAIASNSSFVPTTGIDRAVLDRASQLRPEVRAKIERECMPMYLEFAERGEAM